MQQRQQTFETVCSFDPELRTEEIALVDMVKFVRTRELGLLAAAMSGRKPTTYTIREIPHALWGFVRAGQSDEERYDRAFMFGVERVTNLYQSDGTLLEGPITGTRVEKVGTAQISVFSEEGLGVFRPSERLEIGSVAFTHSFLALRIGDCFRLPHGLASMLDDRDFLRAGSSPSSQG